MIRAAVLLWLGLTAGMAAAQPMQVACPDFYRFVDFGLTDPQGSLNAGGKYLRAEDFDGTPLLLFDQMTCLDLPFIRTDGRGNPIPVVDQALFHPDVLPTDVISLRVERDLTLRDTAFEDAQVFQSLLGLADATITRGDSFLCVAPPTGPDLACQFQQVYDGPDVGDLPLFVFCEAGLCSLTPLPVYPSLGLSATWQAPPDPARDPAQSAPMLLRKVLDIKDFIDALL